MKSLFVDSSVLPVFLSSEGVQHLLDTSLLETVLFQFVALLAALQQTEDQIDRNSSCQSVPVEVLELLQLLDNPCPMFLRQLIQTPSDCLAFFLVENMFSNQLNRHALNLL